jgi:DNA-binding FadR family transcriptional regulator
MVGRDELSEPCDRRGSNGSTSPSERSRVSGGSYRPGYELAAEKIIELISREGLVPGDRLPTEQELADTLGTSRRIVRESIKILSALGRVRVRKRSGIYVADDPGMFATGMWTPFIPTNLEHVLALFEFRAIQEMNTARLAAERATPVELGLIRDAAALSIAAAERGDMTKFVDADELFHSHIATASHNPMLASAAIAARRLQQQTTVLGLSNTPAGPIQAAAAGHAVISDSIHAGNAAGAASAMEAHVHATRDDYREELQKRLFKL